jgi:hypothetical protein
MLNNIEKWNIVQNHKPLTSNNQDDVWNNKFSVKEEKGNNNVGIWV